MSIYLCGTLNSIVVFHVKQNVEMWMDFVGKFSFHVKLF
jgi:hypothetical protein